MDAYLFTGFLVLVFVGLPVGLGCSIYFVLKKLGYPRTAKYLTITYGIIILTVGSFVAFEDQLFTKNKAKELVEEQGIKLRDEFELLKNESMSAIGEYYHTFTLKISERDKQDAIKKIKSADHFKANNNLLENSTYQALPDRYFGKKVTQNYETQNSFVREYFEPSGRKGYAPTFRRISINKINNELIFEDIDD